MSTRTSPPALTLRARWLLPARVAWVAVAVTALAIILFSIPSSFEHYRSVCTAASEVCAERAVDQATPEGVRALGDIGLSLRVSVFLLSVGPVAVDPTAAYTLISSQSAWLLPVRIVDIVGSVSPVLFFFLFPSGRFVP